MSNIDKLQELVNFINPKLEEKVYIHSIRTCKGWIYGLKEVYTSKIWWKYMPFDQFYAYLYGMVDAFTAGL